jgi:predicted RecA/RadA family phage recombinase
MKNQLSPGDALTVAAPSGGVLSGSCYQLGAALFGIAGASAASGVNFALWVKGVFSINKSTDETWDVGDIIYWSPTFQYATNNNSSSDLQIGVCVAAVATATIATGAVRLTPG